MSSFNIILGRSGLRLKEEELSRTIRVDPEKEAEDLYLRVKKRAEEEAKSIIEKAYKEAERIKQQAALKVKEELNRVEEEKKNIFRKYSEELKCILNSLKKQKEKILQEYQEELVTFIKVVTEMTLNIVLEERYKEVFLALLKEALSVVEGQKNIKVIVNGQDLPLVRSLFESIEEKDLDSWDIIPRDDVEKGTVILETPSLIIDNSVLNRLAQAKEKIKKLSSL